MEIKADINKGLAIEINGELGKYQTLPIEYLIKIAESLQELVNAVAESDISGGKIDMNNFKIELSGYIKSSAVPEFILTPRVPLKLHDDLPKQRLQIANKIDAILKIANDRDFSKLKELYPDANRRNKIVESIYDFTNSFNNSPTSFGGVNNGKFSKGYSLYKLKKETKESLLVDIKKQESIHEPEEYTEFREMLVTVKNKKAKAKLVISVHREGYSISYSPNFIVINNTKYVFNMPPISTYKKETDHYVIENYLLDIYAVGGNPQDTEKDFNEQFDYLYRRLNSLDDEKLAERLIKIKSFINYIVKDVSAW